MTELIILFDIVVDQLKKSFIREPVSTSVGRQLYRQLSRQLSRQLYSRWDQLGKVRPSVVGNRRRWTDSPHATSFACLAIRFLSFFLTSPRTRGRRKQEHVRPRAAFWRRSLRFSTKLRGSFTIDHRSHGYTIRQQNSPTKRDRARETWTSSPRQHHIPPAISIVYASLRF